MSAVDALLAQFDARTFHTNRIDAPAESKRQFGHFSLPDLLSALYHAGELRGVLLTTFCLNLSWLKEACPFLFGSDGSEGGPNLPVYILHDCRTPIRQWRCGATKRSDYTSTAAPAPTDDDAADSQGSNFADSQETIAGAVGAASAASAEPYGGWTVRDVPDEVQIEHLPPTGSDGKVTRGVQHSKLALLLCETRLIVVVSTANLVRQRSVDLSWLQAFPVVRKQQQWQLLQQQQPPFGADLERFLQELQRTGNWRGGGDRIQAFLKKVVGGIVDEPPSWLRCFDFSAAKVDLVATVPGEFKRSDSQGRDNCSRFGAERVAALLRMSSPARCEPVQADPVVLQPTSIGAEMTEGYMAYLQCCYASRPPMEVAEAAGEGGGSTESHGGGVPMHLVWPSQSYIDRCCSEGTAARQQMRAATATAQPSSSEQLGNAGAQMELVKVDDRVEQQEQQAKLEGLGQGLGLREDSLVATTQLVSGGLFMTIEMLVGMGSDVKSRLHHFDPLPTPALASFQPHVKLYFRAMTSRARSYRAAAQLQYALLTSACLSRGAQGFWKDAQGNNCDATGVGECFVMRNFELGVMLRQSDRMELWAPQMGTPYADWSAGTVRTGADDNDSDSSNGSTRHTVDQVHLPIPFAVPARSYLDPDGVGEAAKPFCHDRSKEHWFHHLDDASSAAQRSPEKTLVIEHVQPLPVHRPLQSLESKHQQLPAAPSRKKKRKLKWVPELMPAMRRAGVWHDATAKAAALAEVEAKAKAKAATVRLAASTHLTVEPVSAAACAAAAPSKITPALSFSPQR